MRNVLPLTTLDVSPNFLVSSFPTDGTYHRTFGCGAFIYIDGYRKATLESPGHPARFFGYADGHRTQLHVLDEQTNVISPYPTSNVEFNEVNTEAVATDIDIK